jgi:hypothetical protein
MPNVLPFGYDVAINLREHSESPAITCAFQAEVNVREEHLRRVNARRLGLLRCLERLDQC